MTGSARECRRKRLSGRRRSGQCSFFQLMLRAGWGAVVMGSVAGWSEQLCVCVEKLMGIITGLSDFSYSCFIFVSITFAQYYTHLHICINVLRTLWGPRRTVVWWKILKIMCVHMSQNTQQPFEPICCISVRYSQSRRIMLFFSPLSHPALNLSPIQFVLFDNIKPRDARQCLGTEQVLKSAEWYC